MSENHVRDWSPAVAEWWTYSETSGEALEDVPCKIGESLECTELQAEPIDKGYWKITATFARKAESNDQLRLENARLRAAIEQLKQELWSAKRTEA